MEPNIFTLPLDPRKHRITGDRDPEVTLIRHKIGFVSVFDHLFTCRTCGDHVALDIREDIVVAKEECPYPDGLVTVTEVAFPSGSIVVSDDLRDIYDVSDKDRSFASYNSSLGVAQVVEAMAEIGCAYGYVGNTSPSLYQTGEGSYIIARPGYDEDAEDEDEEGSVPGWKHKAYICTDLWAYSIADAEDWLAKGGDLDRIGITVVEVPPGTYRFTLYSGQAAFDPHGMGQKIYAAMELIKEQEN